MPIDSRTSLGPKATIKKELDAPYNSGPYIGLVKEINDPLKMGSVLVYIASLSGPDQDKPNNYISCRYASPFWGQTPLRYAKGTSEYADTQKSYGMWFPTVDVDTRFTKSGVKFFCESETLKILFSFFGITQNDEIQQQQEEVLLVELLVVF